MEIFDKVRNNGHLYGGIPSDARIFFRKDKAAYRLKFLILQS